MHIGMSSSNYAILLALRALSLERKSELTLVGGATPRPDCAFVEKFIVPKQKGSAGFVEVDGPPTYLAEIEGMSLVWVHTHLCEAFWSQTDENTQETFRSAREGQTIWTVSIVVGKSTIRGRIDIDGPPFPTVLDELPIIIEPDAGQVGPAMTYLRRELDKKFSWSWKGAGGWKGGHYAWPKRRKGSPDEWL